MHKKNDAEDFLVVIPARIQSTRFPGKPLVEICGKSMLCRVWEICVEAVGSDRVLVATPDVSIYDHCKEQSIKSLMTSSRAKTGTDRCGEVSSKVEAQTIINVQGDEPLINPDDILKIISASSQWPDRVINGMCRINEEQEYRSLNIPKVVTNLKGELLYMSRGPVPSNKENVFNGAMKQVCIYAFPKVALSDFMRHEEKTPLEFQEDIEILRFLEFGHIVQMVELSQGPMSVDTPDDLKRVREIFLARTN